MDYDSKESEIVKLIIDILKVSEKKSICIKKQLYQEAAALRDEEKELERNLYFIVFNFKEFNYHELDNWFKAYLKEHYNIEYEYHNDNYMDIIRDIKLKQLGI